MKNKFIYNLICFFFLFFNLTIIHAQNNKQIIGYYPNWQWYKRAGLVNPKTIDYSKYTIINYSFFKPEVDGSISSTDAWADENLLLGEINWSTSPYSYKPNTSIPQLAHAAGTKLLISIGGWTLSDNFPGIAASSIKRQLFATSCVDLIKQYNLDGIDIDWEYPGFIDHSGTPADKVNFTLFLQAIRTAIDAYGLQVNKTFLLTAAVGASASTANNIDWVQVTPLLDYVNMMTYDFFGTYSTLTSHNSPLYPPAQGDPSCIQTSVDLFSKTYNIPLSKMNVGIAFYGKSVTNTTGLYKTHSGLVDNVVFAEDLGNPMYYNIVANQSLFNKGWDSSAHCPWIIGKSNNIYVTYDDEQSIGEKAQFVCDKNAAGVIIWDMTGDYFKDGSGKITTPLVDTIYKTFIKNNLGTVVQTIVLQQGWNLISTNVHVSDSSIANLFASLDVQEIKNANSFWKKGQIKEFNSLQSLTAGKGYLVKMNIAGTLTISGIPLELQLYNDLKTGWNLIGCQFQSSTAFSTVFNATNCEIIKDFNGFWIPNGSLNSINSFEKGQGYFMKAR